VFHNERARPMIANGRSTNIGWRRKRLVRALVSLHREPDLR
jgi:hypothetical protein